jgi:hypothetical protein
MPSQTNTSGAFSTNCVTSRLIPRPQMVTALRELHRLLRREGLLIAAFHLGTGTLHFDEWWERSVSVDFHFFRGSEIQVWMKQAGFEIEECVERDPYPGIEHQSRRAYVFARSQ